MDASLLLPAFWGAAGAFIYAGPRWVACLVASHETKAGSWVCFLELVVALAVGSIASAAFSALAHRLTNIEDSNAVAAMIGLLANPLTPAIVKRATDVASTIRVGTLGGGQ